MDSCASLGLVKKCCELRTSVAEKDEASAPQAACKQALHGKSTADQRACSHACAHTDSTVSLLLRSMQARQLYLVTTVGTYTVHPLPPTVHEPHISPGKTERSQAPVAKGATSCGHNAFVQQAWQPIKQGLIAQQQPQIK